MPCFLLQRALPLADEPDDSPVEAGGDTSGKRKTYDWVDATSNLNNRINC